MAAAYVSLIRGTPLLVQIFVIYYGLPGIGIEFSPVTAGILALSLNAGAYLCESIRGAILAVGRGQWSASYSLGMTYRQTLRHVILPQAMRSAVPSMSNTLISLIKDTSLVSVITVTELMLATKDVIATTFRPLSLYIMAALAYWGLSLCLEMLQASLERRLNVAQHSRPDLPEPDHRHGDLLVANRAADMSAQHEDPHRDGRGMQFTVPAGMASQNMRLEALSCFVHRECARLSPCSASSRHCCFG